MIGNEIPLPEYATPGSAGMDLRACIENPIEIPPGAIAVIPTGISIALPRPNMWRTCCPQRLAIKHGIALANGVGVIDSDYRGEIRVGVINQSTRRIPLPGASESRSLWLCVSAARICRFAPRLTRRNAAKAASAPPEGSEVFNGKDNSCLRITEANRAFKAYFR